MSPALSDALDDLEAMGLTKLSGKLAKVLPAGNEPLSSQLLALSTARDMVEVAAMTLDAANKEMSLQFDLVRTDILAALQEAAVKAIGKAA